ncbi:MAG: hypothetical protein KatS3mg115_0589 [Candidatus Poribacteria bacterium]|nr:MAG: hypothetical protein KatS3mg115_0589 [Candidatus Poribacteria bacterium]
MKRFTSLCGALFLSAGLMGGMSIQPQAQELPVEVAFDFTYASAYYWRGGVGATGLSQFAAPPYTVPTPATLWPSADISFSAEPITVGLNVWGAIGMEVGNEQAGRDDFSEVDYTLYADVALEPLNIGGSIGGLRNSAGRTDEGRQERSGGAGSLEPLKSSLRQTVCYLGST